MTSLGGCTLLDAYVPILIAFTLAILSLTALPMVLASYRERGVLRRLQTTPIGPARVLGAQLAANLTVAAATVVLVLAVARLGYQVSLPRQLAGFVLAALQGRTLLAVLVLCAADAAWMLWMFTLHPAWRVRPRPMAVFFTGQVLIMFALVIKDPWFGFFTPAGYFYAACLLRWPWQLAGVASVAVVAATAQSAAVNKGTPLGVLVYVAVIAVNAVPLCGAFSGPAHISPKTLMG